MEITAITYLGETKRWYIAECPELGVASQGLTEKEALANLKEATELYLEAFPQVLIRKAHITTLKISPAHA